MKNLLSRVGAMALAFLLPCAALAQAPVGKTIQAPSGYLPAQAIYCDDGTGHAALCNFGNGGSGTATITSRISYTAAASGTGYSAGDQLDRIVTTSPGSSTVNPYWVNVSAGGLLTSAPAAANITLKPETLTNTVFGATQSGAWNVGVNNFPTSFQVSNFPASFAVSNFPSVFGSTVADGANQTMGSKADAKCTSTDTTACSQIALTKGLIDRVVALLTALGSPYQAGGAVPLSAGAATDAKLEAVRALLAAALTINLPSGASTAAKQDANTAAIGATQAATGTLATTGQTVTVALPQITATSRSGLFGTTASQLMPANTSRHFIQVQVQASSATCYINGMATATADQNSLLISGASGMFESTSHVGTGAISIICSAASTPVYAREG